MQSVAVAAAANVTRHEAGPELLMPPDCKRRDIRPNVRNACFQSAGKALRARIAPKIPMRAASQ